MTASEDVLKPLQVGKSVIRSEILAMVVPISAVETPNQVQHVKFSGYNMTQMSDT
jgi:hypothetical protein